MKMRYVGSACLGWLFAVVVVAAAHANPPQPGGSFTPMPDLPVGSVDIDVVSGPDGVTIYISVVGLTPGNDGAPGGDDPVEGTEGPSCTATPMNIGNSSIGWVREGLLEHPDAVPWWVVCDNGYTGVAWVPVDAPAVPDVVVGAPPAPAVDPAAIAASLLDTVPLPPIEVGANPGVGLVAMPVWFWVEGYDGSTLSGARTLGAITVEVEITPTGTQWSFGDGAVLETSSLGQPYPTESDLRHTYEQSSQIAGGTFTVQLDITFDARYRVNGGPWLPLAPVMQTFTRDYPVQQLQSVLTSSR
jgi:hypothetical protein